MKEQWITMSKEYLDRKSKYKHYMLGCCAICRNIQIYKVTDDMLNDHIIHLRECDECGGSVKACVLTKYQKPPGFARKCRKCDFRFGCATVRIEEVSTILMGITKVEFSYTDKDV